VSENRVLRRIFRPKRNEVTGEWRRLHKEKLYDLYSSPRSDLVKKKEMVVACSTYGGEERCMRCSLWKPYVKRPLLHWLRREDNITMYLKEIGWDGLDWIDLAEDREKWRTFMNAVMNIQVPLNAGNFLAT
jgi:hypothetical protein